jgi:lysozyme
VTARKKPVRKRKAVKKSPAWKLGLIGLLLVILSPFYYGYVLKLFSATWRWVADIGESPNYRTYRSFGIRIPVKYKLHGIDVSYAQGKIDWPQVRAMQEDSVHIRFAFIKATEGLLTVDPYFKRNWREGAKPGLFAALIISCGPKRMGCGRRVFSCKM